MIPCTSHYCHARSFRENVFIIIHHRHVELMGVLCDIAMLDCFKTHPLIK